MSRFQQKTLEEIIQTKQSRVEKYRGWVEEGKIEPGPDSNYHYAQGGRLETVGIALAFLGDSAQATEYFGRAARHIIAHTGNERRALEEHESVDYENHPAILIRAIQNSLLATDDNRLNQALSEVDNLSEQYLQRYGNVYAGTSYQYYNVKLMAEIVRGSEAVTEFLGSFDEVVPDIDDPSAEALSSMYHGFASSDPEFVLEGFESVLEAHERKIDTTTDDLRTYANLTVSAALVLAHERGLEVSIQSEYILSDLIDYIKKEQRPESRPGFPESADLQFECSGEECVIELIVTHSGDQPIESGHIPETAWGRIFTESWLRSLIEHLKDSKQASKVELGESLAIAQQDDRLQTRLVVEQCQQSGNTIGESIANLDIDSVEIVKGHV